MHEQTPNRKPPNARPKNKNGLRQRKLSPVDGSLQRYNPTFPDNRLLKRRSSNFLHPRHDGAKEIPRPGPIRHSPAPNSPPTKRKNPKRNSRRRRLTLKSNKLGMHFPKNPPNTNPSPQKRQRNFLHPRFRLEKPRFQPPHAHL